MTAIEITEPQNSEGWYQARLGLATTSRFGLFFTDGRGGKESTQYRNYVINTALERVTGKRTETYRPTDAIAWGHDTEALAADRYEIATGLLPEVCGMFWDADLQAGSSPDRLVGKKGLVQIKCPEQAEHLKTLKTLEIPEKYYWQLMGEMFITDREWNDFCSFNPDFPEDKQLVIIRLFKDSAEFAKLRTGLERFNNDVAEVERFIRGGAKAS